MNDNNETNEVNLRGLNPNYSNYETDSTDEPIITNKQGGSQTDIGVSFHLFDPIAITETAKVLHHGAKKYSRDNWRLIEAEEHVNHAIQHLFNFLQTGNLEEICNASCRTHMASAMAHRPNFRGHKEKSVNRSDDYIETSSFNANSITEMCVPEI